jgi:hypothetical protein
LRSQVLSHHNRCLLCLEKNIASFLSYAKAMPETNYLPDSPSLRTPASKRISLPVSQRSSTVTEGAVAQAPSSARWSARTSTSTAATHRTAPPPYQLLPPLPVRNDIANPNDEEKLGRLRRKLSATERRGGWGRLALLVAALLGLIGLAVGLGVGLTTGEKKNSDGTDKGGATYTQQSPDDSMPAQQLPLGQYSFVTNLRAQQTNCTTNPATWRCYPYSVLDPPNPSTNATSQSTFNWIIRNTSAIYATKDTPSTPSAGIPANLTLSSTNNPFALTFTNQTLTYHSSSDDGSASSPPVLTFAFTLPKTVVPTSAIASDNSATQCFFNSTILSGRISLAASSQSLLTGSAVDDGDSEQWPYGVEVLQSSAGGEGTPDCYKTVNGGLSERVTEGLESIAAVGEECRCEYSNF